MYLNCIWPWERTRFYRLGKREEGLHYVSMEKSVSLLGNDFLGTASGRKNGCTLIRKPSPMSCKEALGPYWFLSVNFGALMPWTLGEEGGVYVSSRESIFIAEGTEQDKGRRQAEKERRRKEEREEHHISPAWSCASAGSSHPLYTS